MNLNKEITSPYELFAEITKDQITDLRKTKRMTNKDKIDKAVQKINDKGYTVFYIRDRYPLFDDHFLWSLNGGVTPTIDTPTQKGISMSEDPESVGYWDYVIKCKNGHKQTIKHGNVHRIGECGFCEGKYHTKTQVIELLSELGLTANFLEVHIDDSNNQVVNLDSEVTYTCSAGHKQTETLEQILAKTTNDSEVCKQCS